MFAWLKNLRIATRLSGAMALLMGLSILVISLLIGYQARQTVTADAQTIAKETAYHYAYLAQNELKTALDYAHALAEVFSTANSEESFELTRSSANLLLKNFIERNSSFFGVYVAFEPNAFDGKDKDFIGALGHDQTGRFIPYWTLDPQGKGFLEPLLDYEKEGIGDYYLLPKKFKRQVIIEPYVYPVQGKEVLITSLVAPILDKQGNFSGIAGTDLLLNSLQTRLKSVKIPGFKQAYAHFYSAKGFVVAGPDDAEVGKTIEEISDSREMVEYVKRGEEFLLERESKRLGKKVWSVSVPIEIGDSGIRWTAVVNIPLNELDAPVNRLMQYIGVVGAVAVLLSIFMIYLLTRRIAQPLRNAVKLADRIAGGELEIKIAVKGRDEIGQLMEALENMRATLARTAKEIKEISATVASGSLTLSSTSQQMSHGVASQAQSVEQISTSMEQMSSNIKENSDNAGHTEKIAMQVASDAEQSGQAVAEAVEAMRQIAGKIPLISEIARKINLLALNASIEAARAGKYGAGFKVVAAAIRELAENSQVVAGQITELSGSSMEVAERTKIMLDQLLPNIRRTADLVREISAASREQSIGANQINQAVSQLRQVIQESAGVSEELAAMAEELAAQTERLESQQFSI